jgi:hypothetical protein
MLRDLVECTPESAEPAKTMKKKRQKPSRTPARKMNRQTQRTHKNTARKRRKLKSRRERGPTTARTYFSRSRKFQETWDSVAHVISKMRTDRVSLRRASKEFGIDPDMVLKLGRSALRKQRTGKYVARKTDRLLRILSVLTSEGRREIAVRDSHQASMLGKYWASVQRYLQTGDDSALRKFKGKKITDASRKRHPLITDLNQLNTLGSAGVLSFESFYAGVR